MGEEKNPFGLMTEADIFARVVYTYALENQHVGMEVVYQERGVRCRGLKFGNKLIPFRDIGLAGVRPLRFIFIEMGLKVFVAKGCKFDPEPSMDLYIRENDQPALLKHWESQFKS